MLPEGVSEGVIPTEIEHRWSVRWRYCVAAMIANRYQFLIPLRWRLKCYQSPGTRFIVIGGRWVLGETETARRVVTNSSGGVISDDHSF